LVSANAVKSQSDASVIGAASSRAIRQGRISSICGKKSLLLDPDDCERNSDDFLLIISAAAPSTVPVLHGTPSDSEIYSLLE